MKQKKVENFSVFFIEKLGITSSLRIDQARNEMEKGQIDNSMCNSKNLTDEKYSKIFNNFFVFIDFK